MSALYLLDFRQRGFLRHLNLEGPLTQRPTGKHRKNKTYIESKTEFFTICRISFLCLVILAWFANCVRNLPNLGMLN